MEYCSEGTLREIIKKHKVKCKPIPEGEVIKYVRQMLLGADYIHKSVIIHRDLKPENVLVDSEGNLKVSNFGISKELEEFIIGQMEVDIEENRGKVRKVAKDYFIIMKRLNIMENGVKIKRMV